MLKFPNDFAWGAATSGPQSEGNFHKPNQNVFDYWFEQKPGDFYDGVGPDTASNFYNDYQTDIPLMAKAGIKALRTSIQWTRLIKDLDTGEVDPDGVEFYNNVINCLIANGIEPYINLFHFDLPVKLYQEYGGWESKHVTDLFADYAEKCFELFGDRVKNWFTFNEPKVILDGEYLYQFHYPLLVDGPAAVQVAYNLNLASAKAIKNFKTWKKANDSDAKIGTILNLTPAYPATNDSEDVKAAKFATMWDDNLFLDPAVLGHFPAELVKILDDAGVLWKSTPEELQIIQENTVDVLGVNFYHPERVQRPSVSPASLQDWMPDIYFDNYEMPGRVMNVDKGWEIYPQTLYDIAINLRDNYGNLPWFVSENGMGVSREERFMNKGEIQDDYRIKFIHDHLVQLHKGIEAGSNCHGYFVWTAIDCWSWKNAYRNRYGLIRDDIHTQTKTLKKSGRHPFESSDESLRHA